MIKGVTPSMTKPQKRGPPLEKHDVLRETKRSAEEPLPSIITKDGVVEWRELGRGVDEQRATPTTVGGKPLRNRSGIHTSWNLGIKIGPEARRSIVLGKRGLTKTPTFTKPASCRALIGTEMCNGERVALEGGVAEKGDRAPQSRKIDAYDRQMAPDRRELVSDLAGGNSELGPELHGKNIAPVEDGKTWPHEEEDVDNVSQNNPHGVARDSGEPEHEHQAQIEAVDPRPRMAQGALGEVKLHADGLQERRGLLDFMADEMTILELRQDAVESKLAGSEVGRCDVRILHVGGANHGALAKFWCRALLFEKKGRRPARSHPAFMQSASVRWQNQSLQDHPVGNPMYTGKTNALASIGMYWWVCSE